MPVGLGTVRRNQCDTKKCEVFLVLKTIFDNGDVSMPDFGRHATESYLASLVEINSYYVQFYDIRGVHCGSQPE